MEVRKYFTVIDYVLFALFLGLPVVLGIASGLRRNVQTTSRELLLGHRNLGVLPMALTLVATYLSTVSVLGYPAEIYVYGTMFLYYFITYVITYPLVAYVFLPTVYPLQLTSVYEVKSLPIKIRLLQYLELRFNKTARTIGSAIFFMEVLLYLPVALYAPALALNSVTGLSIHVAILTTGLAATAYTTVGGSTAVVWTSVLQMVFVFAGILAVVIFGTISVDGMANVIKYAYAGHRIQFTDFRIDPHVRHSVWSLVIGGTFVIGSMFSVNQMSVQRYFAMPTLRSAQWAVLLNIPINILCFGLLGLCGLVVYASYRFCDPFLFGAIAKPDQLLTHYVMDKLSGAVGLPGLFVSALYGAGMSTLANGSTALAAVVLEDFYKPIHRSLSTTVLTGVIGLTLTGLSLAISSIKSTVIALSIFGIAGGPLLGVFLLGMFFPFANKYVSSLKVVNTL
ncbi:unnamed protein product [Soboliphyme baturini]|uniref:Sodium-coupled monocarboxylate transporter 1 n=1 Tax=Soboliphyme baturini TaxID=241478 RepID=A0A183IC33_9BILA|nr:unnamed protein product [Soboliphyme baturini]